ncbi:uncharacterized protein LOC124150124 [Haliotis rufescens]|uniref:uncharacterized protein LOC124150124 n=1 Tax=Haliotis rufescens TaxID=6454 RepID=UPI001EB0A61D|nr:uncharacterized protein LOC124150124 [Haliotis rufescens]
MTSELPPPRQNMYPTSTLYTPLPVVGDAVGLRSGQAGRDTYLGSGYNAPAHRNADYRWLGHSLPDVHFSTPEIPQDRSRVDFQSPRGFDSVRPLNTAGTVLSEFEKTRVSHREVRPDKFDGTSCDCQDYIVHFEQVASWNGWTEYEKAQQLSMFLRGAAQKLLSNLTLGQLNSYQAVKSALSKSFYPVEHNVAYRSEFRNRRQGHDETVSDYGYQLRRLANSAYPTSTYSSLEVHLIDQFLTGLHSFDMRKHVTFAHPQTLENAISYAIEFEAVDGSRRKKPETLDRGAGINQTVQPVGSTGMALETVAKMIDDRLESFKCSLRSVTPNTCYVCNQPGHFRDRCPNLSTLGLRDQSVTNKPESGNYMRLRSRLGFQPMLGRWVGHAKM